MNIVKYICGAVRIRIYGEKPEQFVNIFIKRGIPVWDLRRTSDTCFEISSLKGGYLNNVRDACRKSGCKVHVIRRGGLIYAVRRLRYRKALIISLPIACAAILLLSSMVWSVEIKAGERATTEDVVRTELLLDRLGVRPGIFTDTIDKRALSMSILASQKDLCWVNVVRRGTKIYIEIERGVSYQYENQAGDGEPCDIAADKDCEIVKCNVFDGAIVCKPGQLVRAGDVIVTGVGIEGAPNVRAKAEIIGKTWYSVKIAVVNERKLTEELSRTEQKRLFVFGLEIPLPNASMLPWNKNKDTTSDSYSTVRNVDYLSLGSSIRLPLGTVTQTYIYTAEKDAVLSDEEAIEQTRIDAAAILDEKIPDNATVLSTYREITTDGDGQMWYTLRAECTEPIGIAVQIQEQEEEQEQPEAAS